VTPEPRFVLDASIAITWAMRDEDHPTADLAFSMLEIGSAIVPAIWWYEIRNTLIMSERRARILPEDSDSFLRSLEQLRIDIDPSSNQSAMMILSRKHGLSVYDAAYLAVAVRDSLQIATLDKALEAAALAEGVPLLS